MADCRITVLVENTVRGRALRGEHGLAFWIEFGCHKVLFDTGQSDLILDNAIQLDSKLNQAEAVVVSHGHYDHTGGLVSVLDASKNAADVYIHPAAFAPKFSSNTAGDVRVVGMQPLNEKTVREKCSKIVFTAEPTEICPGLFVTGEIPRVTDYENTGGMFFLDETCRDPDPLLDDQAMYFESSKGTVIILGCAHSGIINTISHIKKLTNNRPVYSIIGGTHLINATALRIGRTIDALCELNITKLAPAHCTGPVAMGKLWTEMSDKCVPCNVGTVFKFDI